MAKFSSENPYPIMRVSSDGAIIYVNDACRACMEVCFCQIGDLIPENWQKVVTIHVLQEKTSLSYHYYTDALYDIFH